MCEKEIIINDNNIMVRQNHHQQLRYIQGVRWKVLKAIDLLIRLESKKANYNLGQVSFCPVDWDNLVFSFKNSISTFLKASDGNN